MPYSGLDGRIFDACKEAIMGRRDKPGREKRRPKKEKLAVTAKPNRGADVLQHVAQHTPSSDERRT
jgi:hypothetical protein